MSKVGIIEPGGISSGGETEVVAGSVMPKAIPVVRISIKEAGALKTVKVSRRATDTSTTILLTVNKSTEVVVE